jgi:hypothetical protein
MVARLGLAPAEAERRIRAYDDGVRTRIRQLFDVDWEDPLLYDLVLNTERVTVDTAVRQVLALAEAAEYQPTVESRVLLEDRALSARVRATLKATRSTRRTDLEARARARDGQVILAGVVSSEEERDQALLMAREVPGVTSVTGDIKVFRRPIR